MNASPAVRCRIASAILCTWIAARSASAQATAPVPPPMPPDHPPLPGAPSASPPAPSATTPDIDAPPVGVDAFIAIEPRDEALHVEQLLRFVNVGSQTWIAQEVVVPVDRTHRAFAVNEHQGDLRIGFVQGRGYRIAGPVPPGVSELSFRYQIPLAGSDTIRFSAFLPPRVAHVRVLSSASTSTSMSVTGFPEAHLVRDDEGQRFLVTDRYVSPGGDQLDQATISIQGLPTPGPARWMALSFALGAVFVGLYFGLWPGSASKRLAEAHTERLRARTSLLERLEALERARRAGEIGPKTYDRARRSLLDSLARLVAMDDASGSDRG